MAACLEEISSILINKITSQKIQELAKNPNIAKLIQDLKKLNVKLSLDYNIKHKANNHKKFYPLRNCGEEHCFDCLLQSIKAGRFECDHSAKLTRYEVNHIPYISRKIIRENEDID